MHNHTSVDIVRKDAPTRSRPISTRSRQPIDHDKPLTRDRDQPPLSAAWIESRTRAQGMSINEMLKRAGVASTVLASHRGRMRAWHVAGAPAGRHPRLTVLTATKIARALGLSYEALLHQAAELSTGRQSAEPAPSGAIVVPVVDESDLPRLLRASSPAALSAAIGETAVRRRVFVPAEVCSSSGCIGLEIKEPCINMIAPVGYIAVVDMLDDRLEHNAVYLVRDTGKIGPGWCFRVYKARARQRRPHWITASTVSAHAAYGALQEARRVIWIESGAKPVGTE